MVNVKEYHFLNKVRQKINGITLIYVSLCITYILFIYIYISYLYFISILLYKTII